MKTTVNLMLAVFLIPGSLLAQNVNLIESKVPTDDVSVDAWVASIGTDLELAKKTFTDYAKDIWDVKVTKENKSTLVAKKVSTPVSEKRGDLKAIFFTEVNETKVGVAYLLGYDFFINSIDYPEGMEKMKTFMRGYQKYYFTEYYHGLIEGGDKTRRNLQKDLQKTEREISSLRKQVNNNESKIAKEDSESKKASLRAQSTEKRSQIESLSAGIPKLHEDISRMDVLIEDHQGRLDAFLVNLREAERDDSFSN